MDVLITNIQQIRPNYSKGISRYLYRILNIAVIDIGLFSEINLREFCFLVIRAEM